jgi:hypothetical protein
VIPEIQILASLAENDEEKDALAEVRRLAATAGAGVHLYVVSVGD